MAVRRAQASILSGVNSAANGLILDSGYSRVNAGYIPTSTSSVVSYTSSTTWSRPSNVHWIDIALVGSGGSGGCGGGARTAGGGGGGAVFQVNQFYVGDYDTWYIIIGAGGTGCAGGAQGNCCCNQWGQPGGPTIFTPTSSSFNFGVYSGVDSSNLRRTLISPGGAGGGHPCGGIGSWTIATSGGMGSNRETNNHWGVVREDFSGTRIVYSGLGGRGAAGSAGTGGGTGFAGGGGGAGGPAQQIFNSTPSSNNNPGPGKALLTPFSGTYGTGGRGGGNANGAFGTGNGGNGAENNSGFTSFGGSGRAEIRQYFSS